MRSQQIILKPIITEKSFSDAQKGVFTFGVEKSANKNEISKTIENMFNVHVLDITTVVHKGKKRIAGKKRKVITQPDSKKARVRLAKGEKIDLFDSGESK